MTGKVTADLAAVITIRLADAGRPFRDFAGVVDTGFNGYVTAPPELIAELGLPVCGDTEAELGDGTLVRLPTYIAEVEWFGQRREVPVLASDGGILLGMSLLRGCKLTIVVEPGGDVAVEGR